jgi:hypothetical protein
MTAMSRTSSSVALTHAAALWPQQQRKTARKKTMREAPCDCRAKAS